MKLVLSPAKSLDFDSQLPTAKTSEACFLKEAERLNKLLKKKSARSLSKLMSISDNLGQLNYERNQEWHLPFTNANARQAVYTFSGDVYRGLSAHTIPEQKTPQGIFELQNIWIIVPTTSLSYFAEQMLQMIL